MKRILTALAALSLMSACVTPRETPSAPTPASAPKPVVSSAPPVDVRTSVRNFLAVVERVEPVAEQVCRQQSPRQNCDFKIVVDDNPNAPANAFQTLDSTGRPIIAFTLPLIAMTRNQDELAFVMSHEAAHHIRGHLQQQQTNASLGALIFGGLASSAGLAGQETAQQLGALLGTRTFSKDYELEADALGTRIAAASGYDPILGAAFFTRIPDPGNQFLGSHPGNAERIATVQRAAAGL